MDVISGAPRRFIGWFGKPQLLIAVTLLATLYLWLPEPYRSDLRFVEIEAGGRALISLALAFSLSALLAQAMVRLYRAARIAIAQRRVGSDGTSWAARVQIRKTGFEKFLIRLQGLSARGLLRGAIKVVANPVPLLTVALFCALGLWLPEPYRGQLGLAGILAGWWTLIGLAFAFSATTLLTQALVLGWRATRSALVGEARVGAEAVTAIARRQNREAELEKILWRLPRLGADEHEWIASAVANRQQTIMATHTSGVAASLMKKGFLTRRTAERPPPYFFDFADDVWQLVNEHFAEEQV